MKLSDRVKSKLAKVNFTSILFFAVSMISITLAWFAYTNTVSSNMNIDLKAWDVKITKNNTQVNNTFSINIDNLYPGMTDFNETYTIHNNGDVDAKISYNITYFRLFDTEVTTRNGVSFAQLERDYPFKVSFTHESRFLPAGATRNFNINCTWPLDSGNDALDAEYGQMAYNYYQSHPGEPGMEIQIEIVISQYIDETNSFATDSWDTIELAIEKGDTSKYTVGNTKTITMDVDGNGTNESYTLRLANKNSPSGICTGSTNSQTACGFVVEFADILTRMKMRDTATNVGGYPATNVYTYLNTTLESLLPIDLQNVLAKTRVVSGYGSGDSSNFISNNQKLYLLSGKEIYNSDSYDTASSNTKQLDYYSNNSVTRDANYSYARKKYNGSYYNWWLRPAHSNSSNGFRFIHSSGSLSSYYADPTLGVSPAFRIA